MSRLVASAAAVFAGGIGLASAASCEDIKDCRQCVQHTNVDVYACHWCVIDGQCHTVASLDSPCNPSDKDDMCISESPFSSCKRRSPDACSAANDESSAPRQIHIALAGPTGMRVVYKTHVKPQTAHVVFSSPSDSERRVSLDSSKQYLEGAGYHNVATLKDLKQGESYTYRIENDGVKTKPRTFSVPAADLKEAKFLVLADMGYGELGHAIATRKKMEEWKTKANLTLHAGDIAYADDAYVHMNKCMVEFCYEMVYDDYMDWIENVTDTKPYMVAVGNHESECHSPACVTRAQKREALRNFTAYNTRWAMPGRESGGVLNMWYSFDYGPVHVVVINTETDFPNAPEFDYGDSGRIIGLPAGHFAPDGEYLRWLEADLKAANESRAQRPWIIAMGHRPWDIARGMKSDDAVRAAHEPLFEKYNVDLLLAGHWHNYQRALPTTGKKGVPTIITGGAGCDEFLGDQKKSGSLEEEGHTDGWDWKYLSTETQIGFMEVTETELVFKAIGSESGRIFDEVKLEKGRKGASVIGKPRLHRAQ